MKNRSSFDKELKKYLHSIRAEIHSSQKSKHIKQLENSILLFADEHNVESMDAIIEEFGSPKTIAAGFLEEENFDNIQKKIKLNHRISRIIALAVIILVAAVIILGIIFVMDTYFFNHGYYVETIISGSYTPNPNAIEVY